MFIAQMRMFHKLRPIHCKLSIEIRNISFGRHFQFAVRPERHVWWGEGEKWTSLLFCWLAAGSSMRQLNHVHIANLIRIYFQNSLYNPHFLKDQKSSSIFLGQFNNKLILSLVAKIVTFSVILIKHIQKSALNLQARDKYRKETGHLFIQTAFH